MPQVSLNQPAPEFQLNDFAGNPVKLSDFQEKMHVILVFNRGFT